MDINSLINNSIASVILEDGIGNSEVSTSSERNDFVGFQNNSAISSAISASLAAGMGGLLLRKKLHAETRG